MMAGKIDHDELRRMWAAGLPSSVIAERFGVSYPAVNSQAKRLGLAPRHKGRTKGQATGGAAHRHKPEPAKPRPVQSTYRTICETAEREGITIQQAMQRHHRARVADAMGGRE